MIKTIGYYILWKVPEMDARYDEIDQLAQDFGIGEKYIPQPPKRRGAWEKATNLGKNYKITPPTELSAKVLDEYGCQPIVRLETVVVSKSAPLLIRHIVRQVAIPIRDEMFSPRRLARKQLGQETVCIMEFDCDSQVARSTGPELQDTAGWVNGSLREIIEKLHNDVDAKMNREDGSKVREGIRQFLLDNAGVLQTAGGAYFLPYKSGLYSDLKTMKVYLETLSEYSIKSRDRANFVIIPLIKTDESLDTLLDIAANAEMQFGQSVEDMIDELSPLFTGNRSQKIANNIRARVGERYARLQDHVNRYKIALDDSLPKLDALLDKAKSLIDKAMAIDTYRKGRKSIAQGEIVQVDTTRRGQRILNKIEIEPAGVDPGQVNLDGVK